MRVRRNQVEASELFALRDCRYCLERRAEPSQSSILSLIFLSITANERHMKEGETYSSHNKFLGVLIGIFKVGQCRSVAFPIV